MQRLLVVGFGDIARRAAPLLEQRFTVVPLSRRCGFDLDQPATLELPAADALLHCAPPPAMGERDTRTLNLLLALEADACPGLYNAADDTHMLMGDWLDLVADHAGLPRPPRIARAEIEARVPATVASFMRESRRLDNRRLKTVLGARLRYPTVQQ